MLSAERDGSLYLACGCATLAGAVGVMASPSHPTGGTLTMSKDQFIELAVAKAAEAERQQRRSSVREGELMARAPLQQARTGMQSKSAAVNPKQTVVALSDNGLSRIDKCLSDGVVAALLAHVNSTLVEVRTRVADTERQRERDTAQRAYMEAHAAGQIRVAGLWPRVELWATTVWAFATRALGAYLPSAGAAEVELESFGAVLAPSSRWDLKLTLCPSVVAALREALQGPYQAVCEEVLGADAVLFECAALVSDPHAPRQPLHPDTAYQPGAGPAVLTLFIALQDIDERMGPTVFLPATHCRESHAAFNAPPETGAKQALLSSAPRRLATLGRGDAMLFDSRLLHCGSANESDARRVLFYFSFRAAEARLPRGTLDAGLERRQLRLDCSSEWLGCAQSTLV
jgi:hypothetical protein